MSRATRLVSTPSGIVRAQGDDQLSRPAMRGSPPTTRSDIRPAHARAEKDSFVELDRHPQISLPEGEDWAEGCGLLIGNSRYEGIADLTGRHGVHLRRLGDKDLPLVEEHLLGLDMPSRNSRFHCGFGDAAVAAYVRDLDPSRDVLFGAMDPGTCRIVGLAEARPANGPTTVDLAASVLPSHRKRGLAGALVTRAAGVASDHGATAADLRFAPGNRAANRIAARLGATFRAPGIAVVRLPLCEPLAEGVARQMGERRSSSRTTAKGPDAATACVLLAFWTTPTMTAGHLEVRGQ